MVKQRKLLKVSSEAKQVRAMMDSLPPGEQLDFYKVNRAAFQELEEHGMRGFDRKVLLEVANLHDAGWQRFFRRWIPSLTSKDVYDLRNALRAIWEQKVQEEQINTVLLHWLSWSTKRHPLQYMIFPWVPDIRTGRLLADPRDLPVRLAMAVLEHFPKLRKCANPDCAVPYFIAKRKSQRFCERGECTRYAQNQYALKWWREKHQSQTTESERSSKRGSRKTK
jgi:hypothetical protein